MQPKNIKRAGFTLIELIITIAIIGILARISIASYMESVNRAKRATAQTAVISLAQAMERYFTKCNSYSSTTAPCTSPVDASNQPTIFPYQVPATGTQVYTLTLATTAATSTTPATFTITATRKSGSAMASDKCGDFTYTSTGTKGITNNTSGVAIKDCWK